MLSALKSTVKAIKPVYRAINRARGSRIHEPKVSLTGARRIGSDYGGWVVDLAALSSASVVYAVGVGGDITFDLGLIDLVGCDVHAFDPTPMAVAWVEQQVVPPQFHFHAIGLADADGEATFCMPQVAGNFSCSFAVKSDGDAGETVVCPTMRLMTIMDKLGHSHIDLIKIDIEGFEYSVIDDLLSSPNLPKQFLVEFHHNMYVHTRSDTEQAVVKLENAGYKLFWVSDHGHEYAFKLC